MKDGVDIKTSNYNLLDFFQGVTAAVGIYASFIFLMLLIGFFPWWQVPLIILIISIGVTIAVLIKLWDTGSGFLGLAAGFLIAMAFLIFAFAGNLSVFLLPENYWGAISTTLSITGIVLGFLGLGDVTFPPTEELVVTFIFFGVGLTLLAMAAATDTVVRTPNPFRALAHAIFFLIALGAALLCFILGIFFLSV